MLASFGVSRLGLCWLGKLEREGETSASKTHTCVSQTFLCAVPFLQLAFCPHCAIVATYLSLQLHTYHFCVSLAIPHLNITVAGITGSEINAHRPFRKRNLYRRSSACGGLPWWWAENWTALLAWVAFVFSLPWVPAVPCGAGWQARGKRPICCMRLFQTRNSTGCHLFVETQGRWDYGEACMCVCLGEEVWRWISKDNVFSHPV